MMTTLRSFTPVLALAVLLVGPVGPVLGQSDSPDTETVVASYPVRGGALGGKPTADHRQVWASVGTFIPSSLLGLVSHLEFFRSSQDLPEGALATDGYASLNEDGETFTLGLSLENAVAAFVERDPDVLPGYRQTILHEFGHVLSFQASQRDLTGDVSGTLVVDEGTMKPDSYLNQFYLRFWKKVYPGRGAETLGDAEGTALFKKDPSAFVTEYAATGPMEDFAESFSTFVVEGKAAGQSLRDQKSRFFSSYPELVALRDQMRRGLASSP